MSDKCEKYEGLFIFSTEEELAKHLEICKDCQREHEKMTKTRNLVQEVGPYYKKSVKKGVNSNIIKIAAGLTVLCLAYLPLHQMMINENVQNYDISLGENESVVSEMGLPTDEYGLLMVY